MFNDLQKKAVSFFSDNASAILTAGGVVGVVGTAVLTGRAAFKAAAIIEAELDQRAQADLHVGREDINVSMSKTDTVKLVGVQFLPPVLVGSTTIAAIIMANRMSAQKAAALAAAYGISQKQLDEYKHKVEEKLGLKKAETIRDEIQQDRVTENPPREIIIVGNGEVLFFDAYSGRYFKSTVEKVRQAEQAVQREIMDSTTASLGLFYDELNLPQIGMSNDVGWNVHHTCTIHLSAILTAGNDPCIAIEFADFPIFEYEVKY